MSILEYLEETRQVTPGFAQATRVRLSRQAEAEAVTARARARAELQAAVAADLRGDNPYQVEERIAGGMTLTAFPLPVLRQFRGEATRRMRDNDDAYNTTRARHWARILTKLREALTGTTEHARRCRAST